MKIIFTLSLLLIFGGVYASAQHAEGQYTFEKSEALKPLINWRDYSPAAFEESVKENKPIFLLLTAPTWCYWCQVYESEDYLFNSQVVEKINSDFVPIYVDADQRQDLTRQYLEGGWPSTTVMTPGKTRLYGFSGVRPVENMLANLQQAIEHVSKREYTNSIIYEYTKEPQIIPSENHLQALITAYTDNILNYYDPEYGGFGQGQKFPQGRTLDFLLDVYEKNENFALLGIVQKTLENQYTLAEEISTNYNLYDPIEGGFHRYGTKRDWTPPHYEKMLYDNARLLKAYRHLQEISTNQMLENVIAGTDEYIRREWYDEKKGGFYGNTDVHGEEHYYGKNPRPKEKPRVETAKYSDWNSDAIITYIDLFKKDNDSEYKKIAIKSLDFFESRIDKNYGAHHFYKEREKGVRGNLLDNANLILAFISGYEAFGDQRYLDAAISLSDYSLNYLYDWNSGGFFERNSIDKGDYAIGENINLRKPIEENGIIALALLQVYVHTNDSEYLNSAMKTLGFLLSNIGSLDRGYHSAKAAQYALENTLVLKQKELESEMMSLERIKIEDFWLNELLDAQEISGGSLSEEEFIVSSRGLEKLQGSLIILIIVSLIAGFLSFISPCTLPILPAYIAFSLKTKKENLKKMTFFFVGGLICVFTLLGMSASFAGLFLRENVELFSQVAGAGIIIFGVMILTGNGMSGVRIKHKKPRSYIGSFIFGGIIGISWTPCVGPILVAILLLASTTASVFSGGILLFAYGIGLALPLIFVAMYMEKNKMKSSVWKILRGKEIIIKNDRGRRVLSIHTTTLFSGLLFVILGYLIFSGNLTGFNQYITSTSFQQWVFSLEETILNLVS